MRKITIFLTHYTNRYFKMGCKIKKYEKKTKNEKLNLGRVFPLNEDQAKYIKKAPPNKGSL